MTHPPPALELDDASFGLPWTVLEDREPGEWNLQPFTEAPGDGALAIPALGAALTAATVSSPWAFAHAMALGQWLWHYTPTSAAPLDQVRGWLEAFYHACEAELWEVATAIAQAAHEGHVPLYHQLGQWGHCREQVEICETLLPHITGTFKEELRQLAGDGRRRLGDYDAARWHYEALLHESQKTDRHGNSDWATARQWAVKARHGLAQLDVAQRHYPSVIRALTVLLPEARALAEVALTIEILQELGLSYGYMGRFGRSLTLLQESQALAQAHGLEELEVTTLRQLARLYEWRGQPQQVLPYIHRCLAIAQAQHNLENQADAYAGLARASFSSRRYREAIAHGEKSLAIYRQIHQADGELIALNDLGVIYAYGLGQAAEALEHFHQAAPVAHYLGSTRCTAVLLANQAYCYAVLHQTEAASTTVQSALRAASDEALAADVRAIAYACLARVHWVRRRYLLALGLVWRALWLVPPWQSLNGQLLLAKAWETLRKLPQQWWQSREYPHC